MPKKLIFLLLVIFFLPLQCRGAEIFFGSQGKEIANGSKVEVGVFLGTGADSINAVEGNINFPADYFDFGGIFTGNSVLSFWVKNPALSSPGQVSFSGIAPGGFSGQKGYLFSIILKAKKTGQAEIFSSNEKALLNDGSGTAAEILRSPLKLEISEKAPSSNFIPLYDPNPPEDFTPQISSSPDIFGGKYFLVFSTQDKESGVSRYEVKEGSRSWAAAESPYLLQDQSLQSDIFIKAIDGAGNQRIAKLNAKNHIAWYQKYLAYIIIVLIVAIAWIILKKFY